VIDARQLFPLDVLQEESNNPAPAAAEVQNGATEPDRANMRLVRLLENSAKKRGEDWDTQVRAFESHFRLGETARTEIFLNIPESLAFLAK
jgi:hypothetical protein